MNVYVAWTIGMIALCSAIGVGCWVTGSAWPLCALVFSPTARSGKCSCGEGE